MNDDDSEDPAAFDPTRTGDSRCALGYRHTRRVQPQTEAVPES
jgi:hypothetical protein